MAHRAEMLVRDGAPVSDVAPARPASTLRPAILVAGAARPPVPRRAPRPVPGQLLLPFAPLTALAMEADWKDPPRLWGHAYHPMCSYLASFPATLAHAFVARYTRPGDVVLDPFSGRGTTALQACAEGRIGVGNDLNPLAHVLTAAKVEPPSGRAIEARLASLRIDWSFEAPGWRELAARVTAGSPALVPAAGSAGGPGDASEAVPVEVALAFHPTTLAQVLFARARLRLADPADRFLAAALVGILHGKRPGYLSELMPNAFSMAPGYVRTFAARTAFASPERDLFVLLAAKLRRLARDGRPGTPGIALLGDARDSGARARAALRERALPDRARLVLTSPPYLRVLKYGYYNWLRTWFLGFSAAAIDATLDDAHRREPYLVFLREVLAGLRPALTDDAVVALVLGDVEAERGRPAADGLPIGLADEVWEGAARPEGYLLAGVVGDEVAASRKMTKLWGDEAGRATRLDRILVVAPTEAGRRRAVAGAALPVDWRWPPRR
ncbi:MAG TPA: DNA methyltransferase [Candidatus Nanopelagicales bacterium]|nr:DNA methyltransferase [Candidatus Nanopelagicales bacterium]